MGESDTMSSMKTYVIRMSNESNEMRCTDIQHLRQNLIRSGLGWNAKAKVYVKGKNGKERYMGEYHQGSYDALWMTPGGKFYVLFRDGSIRSEY